MTAAIRSAMRRRHYHKKKAIKLKSDSHWHNYNRLRNKVNKLIRETKSTFPVILTKYLNVQTLRI
jgi:hypothetical protein